MISKTPAMKKYLLHGGTTAVSLNIIIHDYVYIIVIPLIVTLILVTYWKSIVFMVSLNGLPGSKVPIN